MVGDPSSGRIADVGDAGAGAAAWRGRFALLLGAVTLLRLLYAGSLPLSGDEAYHWEWSRRLAAAYWDHPGLTALGIRVGGWFADGELGVRLPAIACLAATAAVAYAFAASVARGRGRAAGEAARAGFLAGALVAVAPVHALFALYISTDPPFVLFATLTWFLLHRALATDRAAAWLAAGAALGLAASSKFLAFSIVPAAGLLLLLHPPHRRLLARPGPYLALGAALAVFAPVLVWNADHGWATFRFNFAVRHAHEATSPLWPLAYVGGQALALGPWLFAAAVAGLWATLRGWRGADGAARLLAVAAAAPLLLFLATSFRREVGVHWPAAAWVPALVLVALRWSAAWSDAGRLPARAQRALGWTAALTLLAHLAAHVPTSWLPRSVEASGGRPHRTSIERLDERHGWEELGVRVAEVARGMRADAPDRGVFLIGSSYGVAATLAFYLPTGEEVHLWSPRRKHGENYRFWERFDELVGQDAIYVAKRLQQVEEALPELREHFAEVAPAEELTIVRDGRAVRSFLLVRCRGFDGARPY